MEEGVLFAVAIAGAFGAAFIAGRGACLSIEHAMGATRFEPMLKGGMRYGESRSSWRSFFGKALALLSRLRSYYARNGFVSLSFVASRAVASRAGSGFFEASKLARSRGVEMPPESAASLAIGAISGVSLIVLVAFRSVLASVCAIALCVALSRAALSHAVERERMKLREQVPDALRCMEACMHAGLSLPQTFYEVSEQIDQPAKSLFVRVSRDLDLGYSVNEALERFRSVSDLPELAFVAMALDVQYACGGSAGPILRCAEESVSRDLDLRRSLRVQTAQAKLSAQIVSVMPFALVFVISAVDPGFLSPFFSSALGLALLFIAVGMLCVGVLMVRRMLAVEI